MVTAGVDYLGGGAHADSPLLALPAPPLPADYRAERRPPIQLGMSQV
jgi:hypothetical protein